MNKLETANQRIAALEATVREMREALKPMAEAGKKLRKKGIPDWFMNHRGFKVADFDAALAALASSESVVKSEGKKDD